MNCEEFGQLIDLYDNNNDSELSPQKKLEFRIHEKECESCNAEFQMAHKIRNGLQRLNSIEVPVQELEQFKISMRAKILEDCNSGPTMNPLPLATLFHKQWRLVGAMAACVLLLFALHFQAEQRSDDSPLLIASKTEQKPALNNHLFNAIQLQNRAQSGFSLVNNTSPYTIANQDHKFVLPRPALTRLNENNESPIVFVTNSTMQEAGHGSMRSPYQPRQSCPYTIAEPDIHNDIFEKRMEKYLMEKYAIRPISSSKKLAPEAKKVLIKTPIYQDIK